MKEEPLERDEDVEMINGYETQRAYSCKYLATNPDVLKLMRCPRYPVGKALDRMDI